MASGGMYGANVCPTEDAVGVWLEYLVDPKLPVKSTARVAPSPIDQESVAKQVHAVVLLYNYHYRKHHPQLEFLCFDSFCKLVVVLNPSLMAYMGLMQRSDDTESPQLSSTEKKIMDGCQISKHLDASKKLPCLEGWPVSKVAVFLVDSKKENCLLQFGSFTEGVWSPIEKAVDSSNSSSDSAVDPNQVHRKKRLVTKSLKNKSGINEAGFQQLAFSAVKEATCGTSISQNDIVVLESHLTYSTSKERTAAHFYIMQCTQPINDDLMEASIKNVVSSLQEPLMMKNSSWWTHSPAVKYFHLLPYAEILSDWLSRTELPNSVQLQKLGSEATKLDSSNQAEESCEPEVGKDFQASPLSSCMTENFGSKTSLGSPKQDGRDSSPGRKMVSDSPGQNNGNGHSGSRLAFHLPKQNDRNVHPCRKVAPESPNYCGNSGLGGSHMISDSPKQGGNDECYVADVGDDFDKPHNMEINAFSLAFTEEMGKTRNICSEVQPDNFGKMTSSLDQAEVIDSVIGQTFTENKGGNVGNENKNNNGITSHKDKMVTIDHTAPLCQRFTESRCGNVGIGKNNHDNVYSDQDNMGTSDHTTLMSQSTAKVFDQLCTIIASKDKELSHAAVQVILRKRDKLSYQQREIEDQIAQCDKEIQTILNGGEDDLTLKVRSIIDGCSDVCLRDADQGSYQNGKRKRLLEEVLDMKNPCQDMDEICFENSWRLPTYYVWPQDGGFQASATLKAMDCERKIVGDVRPRASEARESAAEKLLAQLPKT